MRKRPPPIKMRSRHESERSNRVTTGWVSRISQVRPPRMMTRKTNASIRPTWRARFALCWSRRDTRSEMKITLSMPRTISSTVNVTSAAHALGSVSRSSMNRIRSLSTSAAQKARTKEVEADGTQRGGNPRSRVEIAAKGRSGQDRPDAEEHDIHRSQARNPQRMHERERRESQDREHGDRTKADPRFGSHHEQVEGGGVPQRGKPAEAVVRQFHVTVGEIERTRYHDDDAGGKRGQRRQQAAYGNRVGRHEDIGDEIDHEVETVAGPARQHCGNLNEARDGSVHAVDDEGGAEPDEHQLPVLVGRRDQRQQRERRARGGEDVNRKGASAPRGTEARVRPILGCGRIAHYPSPLQSSRHSSADRPAKFQLRPNARTRDVSARDTMTSGAIQYSLLRMTTFSPGRLPRIGVTRPSTIFGIWKMRVSPSIR